MCRRSIRQHKPVHVNLALDLACIENSEGLKRPLPTLAIFTVCKCSPKAIVRYFFREKTLSHSCLMLRRSDCHVLTVHDNLRQHLLRKDQRREFVNQWVTTG
ncbi:hypothetical protein RF11_12265 [Thelohanellus kitauei]|uniref:Uncharacterized protein n=1 Tax=Thelohanellus kitauei TaxID=669202 RepID=A0A0C2JTI8_THEKT|nr:hypothetical protein RF11_12265 [Thelohanellus kitauei]